MFALVLWMRDNPKTSSVIPVTHTKKYKNGAVRAKWGSTRQPVRILKTSDDQLFLESLSVDVDGNIEYPAADNAADNSIDSTAADAQANNATDSEADNESDDAADDVQNKVELITRSGVFISEFDLFNIKIECRNDAQEMTRRIMRSIVGEKELRNMTPKGCGEYRPIPPAVLKATNRFVFENVAENARITTRKFMRCLTLMCGNLRR